ncbi:MAG: VWA domain-containing protein, partial [Pseudomonadota bacterium]
LGDFIHALRQAGLPISAAETLDALRAAQLVGIDDSRLLKLSLGTTLTKRLEHRLIYDDLFDQFFASQSNDAYDENLEASPEEPRQQIDDAPPQEETIAGEDGNSDADTPPPPNSALAQQLMNNDAAALQVMIASAAAAAGAQEMRLFTQIPMVTYRVMQAMGDSELQQDLAEMAEDEDESAALQLLQQRRSRLQQQVRDYVEQQYLLFGQGEPQKLRENNLNKVKLTSIDNHNYKLMGELVRKAAKRLASMHSRRRRITKRGLLDVRRTIAANAAYDGFLFHTKWKSTRVERPKVIVICDVSGSVSRVARFLLLFLHSLQDVLPRVRSFVFSSDMAEVTELFDKYDMDRALAEVMSITS